MKHFLHFMTALGLLLPALGVCGAEQEPAPVKPPNILLVLMDDYGTGQFAPMARNLSLDQLDPELLAYTDSLGKKNAYDKQVALETAQTAMPFVGKLSEEGIVFTRAYAASNLCAPSRQGVLTGTSPTRWGVYRNIDVDERGLPEGQSLVHHLREMGYRTGFVGKWHMGARDPKLQKQINKTGGTKEEKKEKLTKTGYFGSVREKDHPYNNGFDYAYFYNRWSCPFYDSELIWDGREYTGKQSEYNTDLFTRKAMDFMGKSMDEEKPFFMELALHSIHGPLCVKAPKEYADRFNTGEKPVDMLYAHIYGVDQSVRRIVEMLKKRGEWENTILFFTSDNGATCGAGGHDLSLIPGNGTSRGHKGQHFQGGMHVPFLMVWPEKIKNGVTVDHIVSLMDIMPTSLDAAGANPPADIDGESLLPILENPETPIRDRLYFSGIHAAAWGFSARNVIGNAEARRDLSPGAWVVIEDNWLMRFTGTLVPGLMKTCPEGHGPTLELFNLKEDPTEQNNVLDQCPEVAERIKADYEKHAKTLPEPHAWDRIRWAELVSDNK